MLERDIALIDSLCEQPAAYCCLEFKQDNDDPKLIGKSCSALSEVFYVFPGKYL